MVLLMIVLLKSNLGANLGANLGVQQVPLRGWFVEHLSLT